MYSKILNPKTGRKVSTKGKLGQNILRKYINSLSNILSGGSISSPPFVTMSDAREYISQGILTPPAPKSPKPLTLAQARARRAQAMKNAKKWTPLSMPSAAAAPLRISRPVLAENDRPQPPPPPPSAPLHVGHFLDKLLHTSGDNKWRNYRLLKTNIPVHPSIFAQSPWVTWTVYERFEELSAADYLNKQKPWLTLGLTPDTHPGAFQHVPSVADHQELRKFMQKTMGI